MRNSHLVRMTQAIVLLAALCGGMPATVRAQGDLSDARIPEASFKEEPYNYMVDSWQSREGLPLDTIRAISETPNGYLWIGTSEGLVWFDGLLFHFYTREEVPALGDGNIDSLLTAKDGSLWIGTEGSGLVRLQNGVFRSFNVSSGPETNFVRAIYQDSTNVIWVATDAGLFRVRGDHLERGNDELRMPIFNANAVLEDHLGRRWVAGNRLFVSDHESSTEYHLRPGESNSLARSLLESRDGTIWVGTVDGVYRMSPGQRSFSQISGITGTVLTLQEAANGEIWASSTIGGVYRVRGEKVARLVAPDTHIGNVVLTIFRDSNRNFWIGTQTGLTRLSLSSMHLIEPLGKQDLAIGAVSLDSDGSLWFAANQLAHIQGDTITLPHLPGISDAHARNLLRAHDGSLWIGTNGSGIYHITSSATKHYDVDNGLVYNSVRSLTEDRDGSLWVGTESGVSHLDAHGFHNFTEANGLAYDSVRSIIEDRDGDIWIATDHGLSHLHGGSFVTDATTKALSNQQVWSLLQGPAGVLWIGTLGSGLYRSAQGSIAHFTTADGLVNDTINAILIDAKNRLWLSTPNAVMLIDLKDRMNLRSPSEGAARPIPMRIFTANVDGRQTRFYGGIQFSGILNKSGDGCFASSHGLWVIHPDRKIEPSHVHMDIEWFTVDGHEIPITDPVTLAASSNRLELVFGLQLLAPQQEWRYRYRLDGFDSEWTQGIPGRRGISYTNLPPGHYTLEAEAWDMASPDHRVRTSLVIIKKPHLYQTVWFRFAAILAILAFLISAYYRRIHQLGIRFRAITEERARIAREMHDTLLQGCASVSALLHAAADNDLGEGDARLHLIQHASTEIRATMDEAREAIAGLRADTLAPLDLVHSIRQMTDRNARKYGIDTTLRVEGLPFDLSQTATRALAMIVREAVFNAILHANAQSIRITLSYSSNELSIDVTDDGQGFLVSATYAEDDYGIKGMHERIDSLGGQLIIDSVVGKGTSVRLRIRRDH